LQSLELCFEAFVHQVSQLKSHSTRSALLTLMYLVPYLPVVGLSMSYQVKHIVLHSHAEYLNTIILQKQCI